MDLPNIRIYLLSTLTPFFAVMAPTANGNTQAPVAANAAAKPTPPTCKCAGRSLVAATTAAGNMGPRKNPSRATAAKERGREGARYRTRWKAVARAKYICQGSD